MLSRLVITFLPKSNRLLISWLQSPSAVILEPPKIKSDTFHCFPIYLYFCIILLNIRGILLYVVVGLVAKSCLTLETLWIVASQAPLFIEFSRQEYWSGLPFPSPGDLPDIGIKPGCPALQPDSLPI